MNNDRVSEIYSGQLFSESTQRTCRGRIHWMCGQIRGSTLLDIGCSQGIASVLAGREGFRVVGVEVEEPSLDYARELLAKEVPAVQERVRFVRGDIFATDLDGERFDTVFLGEILEHQANPRKLFERAIEFLTPGGNVVVTVPFGYHPHDDHKFTFYLSTFAQTIANACLPLHLEIEDGYIRFVGRSFSDDEIPAIDLGPQSLLETSEKAFLEKERQAYDLSQQRLARYKAMGETAAKRNEIIKEQTARLEQMSTELTHVTGEAATCASELERLRTEAEALRKASRLPPILPAPIHVGPATRGLAMLFGSMQHEIHSGQAFRRPHMSLIKTFNRVRKVMRAEATGASSAR